jgi:hypothetical protein
MASVARGEKRARLDEFTEDDIGDATASRRFRKTVDMKIYLPFGQRGA